MRTAIFGASGYAGAEVLRLAASHPDLEVVAAVAESSAGKSVAHHQPAVAALYPQLYFIDTTAALEIEFDLAFLALPHGQSQGLVKTLRSKGIVCVDLGADFRLKDAAVFERWYASPHAAPELLDSAAYGLVERHRHELVGAQLIASPGCYPTATALAVGPFADAGWIEKKGVIVNALSGASGAGRATQDKLHFARLASNAEAYGLSTHRHTPEMEQELGVEVLFTPHLVPVARGMLVTAYAPLTSAAGDSNQALELLRATYEKDPFVVVTDEPPTLKDPVGSNLCFVSARIDHRTNTLIMMSSLDNLIKGAAGQAIQAWNVATGRDEALGLPTSGVTP
ncbi:MAG: N-acetyl-gamma-glutamyl-phosphate reductase [Actinomycetota bacterium]